MIYTRIPGLLSLRLKNEQQNRKDTRGDSTFRSVGDAIREELRRMSWHGLKAIEDSSTATIVIRSGRSDTSATVIRYFTIHK